MKDYGDIILVKNIVFNDGLADHASLQGRICLIDGTEIYTPQRAQNEISASDAKTLYKLYTDYVDVIERCKIVTIQDIEDGGFDLSVKKYIDKKKRKAVSPDIVRKRYFEALADVRRAEDKLQKLLTKGGYIDE